MNVIIFPVLLFLSGASASHKIDRIGADCSEWGGIDDLWRDYGAFNRSDIAADRQLPDT